MFRTHAQLLGFIFSLKPPDLRNRVFRIFVMTCYLQNVKKDGNCKFYRIPAVNFDICRELWLLLMNISKTTYTNWRSLSLPKRDVLPIDHGLSGYVSNASKPLARNAIRTHVLNIAASDGHPLPVRLRCSDKKVVDQFEDAEAIVVLPPRYTFRSLHKEYLDSFEDPLFKVSLMTFMDVLKRDLPFVRVSLRARGLCDICFVFRDTVRTTADKRLVEQANKWREHLNAADATRDVYRDSQRMGRKVVRSTITSRLELVVISYDYAKQLSVPMQSEQTMNEWFSQKKGYDVNLFGIVDEGHGDNSLQYNYVYGERTKHGSIQVASMLHHFLSIECPLLGRSKIVHFHSDSCTGQNKNNIVLGYFMLRVAHGFHDDIFWHFMEVGHTKFRPDEGFGSIRTHLDGRSNVLSMNELISEILKSAESARCVLFPTEEIRNWKSVSDTFNFLAGLKKFFAYKIHIRAGDVNGKRNVVVDVYRDPKSTSPDVSTNLLKTGRQFPSFESFEKIIPKELSYARRHGLFKDVYSVLKRNRVQMSNESKSWWENEIIGDAVEK
eukprot:IDg2286t1